MNTHSCGCATETCGCCEGTQKLTPASVANPPALKALSYRVGTHAQFFETMKARLSTMPVEGVGADGQTPETFRPLDGFTTREPGDPAIALLDGWATVADVLTFYQERIANEGYLRTATERRSILELARLVGYSLRPGVAATVYLAYTLEDKQVDPVEIPIGARAQSIPGPDELPQSFEAGEKVVARTVWNNLQVRVNRPQNLTLDSVLTVARLSVSGTNVNLRKGDRLLFVFGTTADRRALRLVDRVEADFPGSRSLIYLQPAMRGVPETLPLLRQAIQKLAPFAPTHGGTQRAMEAAQRFVQQNLMGFYDDPLTWRQRMDSAADVPLPPQPTAILDDLEAKVQEVLKQPGPPPRVVTDPDRFVNPLLKPPVPQAASSLKLTRNLGRAFERNADLQPQLLVNFASRLKDTYYAAWQNALVNDAAPELEGVFALRVSAPLFAAGAPKQPTYFTNDDDGNNGHVRGQLRPQSDWLEWNYETDEADNNAFLDQAYDGITAGSYVVLQSQGFDGLQREVRQVVQTLTRPRSAYGISGQTTSLELDSDWRATGNANGGFQIAQLRTTQVYAQSEALSLVEEPITDAVSGQEIELGALYNELTSGRWVIFSGERADIPGVGGVKVSELLMISGLRHGYDPNLPGDQTHTTLVLATPTAFQYKRDTLVIYGNVVKATHGETRNEVLGSGDGAQSLQTFSLRQPPLTFVPAPTAAGAESTLHVFVNEVEWHETDSLAGLGPKDRKFVSQTDDAGVTSLVFGNGQQGARLPSGVENIKAVYRNGIGQGGNVQAEQISLLQTRPLGVKSVINPLRASGGADRESRDLARENAPLSVMALDRLVGVQDYADFTRTFAGIGKAAARRLSDGAHEIVHVTIAGADDIPIDPVSDLYQNLLAALRRLGDPGVPVRVDLRELIALALSANVRLQPDYQWEPVTTDIRARLLDEFGFQKRALGQPALLCEVLGVIQNVRGVAYVDVDAFGGIPEKTSDPDGTRRLLTLDEITNAAQAIFDPSEFQEGGGTAPLPRVETAVAHLEGNAIRPAQLAIFTPSVPDTLILNQIL